MRLGNLRGRRVMTGLRAVIGSWNTMAMRSPRSARQADGGWPSSSRPPKRIRTARRGRATAPGPSARARSSTCRSRIRRPRRACGRARSRSRCRPDDLAPRRKPPTRYSSSGRHPTLAGGRWGRRHTIRERQFSAHTAGSIGMAGRRVRPSAIWGERGVGAEEQRQHGQLLGIDFLHLGPQRPGAVADRARFRRGE